jgi:hypothetical protein
MEQPKNKVRCLEKQEPTVLDGTIEDEIPTIFRLQEENARLKQEMTAFKELQAENFRLKQEMNVFKDAIDELKEENARLFASREILRDDINRSFQAHQKGIFRCFIASD